VPTIVPDKPGVHLCVLQPAGYVHSMALLDAALYVRHQFEQLGAVVTVAKNRLRSDAPNLVFGAHLGFDPALARRFCCVFVNLEQLGAGGSRLAPAYLELLRASRVIDYDAANAAAYAARPDAVPLIAFGYAPYLAPVAPVPLEQRPFDLLFFGSINDRRRRFIERVERAGRTVVMFDGPVYGPERDAFIAQSRAVFNCHHYESACFEQVRAFHVLSMGTPLVSERSPRTRLAAAYEDVVSWFDEDSLERYFSGEYAASGFCARAQEQLRRFRAFDPRTAYAPALELALSAFGSHAAAPDAGPAQRLLHAGAGSEYRPGWLNLDPGEASQPDLRLDLGRKQSWPLEAVSPFWGTVELRAGATDVIIAGDALQQTADLPVFLDNCLDLLRPGGVMVVELPCESHPGARRRAANRRMLDEHSWLDATDEFWRLGWFEHRFRIREIDWLDARHARCDKTAAVLLRLVLEKVPTSIAERTKARMMRPDFGGLIDGVRPAPLISVRPAPAALATLGSAARGAAQASTTHD
jgi:SAM-dependent methyltransferase